MNIQQLRERYAAPEIPKCRVCGGELTVQRAGGGPTIWGCTGMVDDPTGERNWIYAEGRSCADEHYERSRWSDYRQGGDADVIELIERLEAAERERDELRTEQAEHDEQIARMESKFSLAKRALDSKTARCEKAETELRRRDAAAGEPVAEIKWGGAELTVQNVRVGFGYGVTQVYAAAPPAVLPELEQDVKNIIGLLSGNEWAEHCTKSALGRKLENEITELHNTYSRAHAVLPPDITFESKGFLSLTSEDFAYNRALEDARKLGAHQQKVVICPPVQYLSKYAADDGHCTTGKLVPNKRAELRDTEWREALDAAGVKWEVKK